MLIPHAFLTAAALWAVSFFLMLSRTIWGNPVLASWSIWFALAALVPTGMGCLARERIRVAHMVQNVADRVVVESDVDRIH